jgi:arylsulfatase A-like enzyme
MWPSALCLALTFGALEAKKPHIVLIVADDLGWNDVGFHGSNQIPTPNIDSLAYDGLILNNYYVNPICTPSRSALLTGRHPIHTGGRGAGCKVAPGLQSNVLVGAAPYALPTSVPTLPEVLGPLRYRRRAVGK